MNLNQSNQQSIGTATVRLCQIEDAQKSLENQCTTLSVALESLEQRLGPVMRSSVLEACGKANVPEEMLVPVAADYRDRFRAVTAMYNRVASMLERLELP